MRIPTPTVSAPGALLRAFLLAMSLSVAHGGSGTQLDDSRTWTFQDLLALGQGGNTTLEQARLDVEGLRWQRLAAYGELLPTVSANLSHSRGSSTVSTSEDANGEVREQPESTTRSSSSQLGIGLNQRLFAGFANTAGLRRALLAEQDVRGADRQAGLQFRHDLLKAAHAVLAARGLLETEQTLLEERQRQLEMARVRLQVGKGTDLDVLQMEIDVGRQQVNVGGAGDALRSAWDRLALLVGATPGLPGRLEMEFSVFEPSWSEEELAGRALELREDLEEARRGEEQQRLQTVAARAGFLPTLDLRLSHNRSEQRSGHEAWEPFPANYGSSASLTLSLPLFQGFSTTNAWQTSRIGERKLEAARRQLELQVRAEVREALASLGSAWSLSRTTTSNVELARRSLDLERERYRLGLASLLQVQSAEATWRQAENEELTQRLAFRDRLAELELAVGAFLATL